MSFANLLNGRRGAWPYVWAAFLLAIVAIVAAPMVATGDGSQVDRSFVVDSLDFRQGPVIDGVGHGTFRLERGFHWVEFDASYWDTEAGARTDAGELVHYLLGSRFKRTQSQYHQRDWRMMTITMRGAPHAAHYYDGGVKTFYRLTPADEDALQDWMQRMWAAHQPDEWLPPAGAMFPGIDVWRTGKRELITAGASAASDSSPATGSRLIIGDGEGNDMSMSGDHRDAAGNPLLMGELDHVLNAVAPPDHGGCSSDEFDHQTLGMVDDDGQRSLRVTNYNNPNAGSSCPSSSSFTLTRNRTNQVVDLVNKGMGPRSHEVLKVPVDPILINMSNVSAKWHDDQIVLAADLHIVDITMMAAKSEHSERFDIWLAPKHEGEFNCDTSHSKHRTFEAKGLGHDNYRLSVSLYPNEMRDMSIDPDASSDQEYCWFVRLHNAAAIGHEPVIVPESPSGVTNLQWRYDGHVLSAQWEYFGHPDGVGLSVISKSDNRVVKAATYDRDQTLVWIVICLSSDDGYLLTATGYVDVDGVKQVVGPSKVATIEGNQATCNGGG